MQSLLASFMACQHGLPDDVVHDIIRSAVEVERRFISEALSCGMGGGENAVLLLLLLLLLLWLLLLLLLLLLSVNGGPGTEILISVPGLIVTNPLTRVCVCVCVLG